MKIKSIILIGVYALMTSCNKNLDVIQKSAITATEMWKTEGDATAAMYGAYAIFRSTLNQNYIFWGDYRAGTYGRGLGASSSTDNLYNSTLSSTETNGTNWVGLYSTINDCNQILKNVPNISFNNEDSKNEVLANAYFLRAFCYFYIVRIWGDAPLLLRGFDSAKQDDILPKREPADLLYNQIGLDIDQALALMPSSVTARTTASKGAINMLKTDYYLWIYKTRNAGADALTKGKQAVDAVLSNNNYELLSSYATVFNTKENNEIIFALHFGKDEYEGGYPQDYLIPLSNYSSSPSLIETKVKVGSHAQWYLFSPSFQAMLLSNSSDKRTPVSLAVYTDTDKGVTYKWINKFPGEWINNTRYFTSDIPIYRYAEAILFKAEIENEQAGGDPLTQINKIAKRAYGTPNYYSSSLTKTQINKILLTERMKEFAAEGKSWWDHIRLGLAFTDIPALVGRQNETNILLWPVAPASINGNPNITQTEGYY